MSETWTPATSTSETWTQVAAGTGLGAFSQLGFSRVITGGLIAFSMKSSDGNSEGWGTTTPSAETWTEA